MLKIQDLQISGSSLIFFSREIWHLHFLTEIIFSALLTLLKLSFKQYILWNGNVKQKVSIHFNILKEKQRMQNADKKMYLGCIVRKLYEN